MARLADELDTAVSAVYRYFPSKGALVAAIQQEAIRRLHHSLEEIREIAARDWSAREVDPRTRALAELVLVGRWLCATELTYPDELRLLQMIMTRQTSMLDPEGGTRIFPVAMQLLGLAVEVIQSAQDASVIDDGSALDRAVIWASGLSGVLQTDDLEKYAPDLFGQTRLARQANLDLLRGWGADSSELVTASALVDEMEAAGPLAP